MKKKIILIVLISLVLLVLAAGIFIGLHLGEIVKAGIEKFGPQMTQTTLTVDSVNVSLLSGSASVKSLVVGNPEGYQTASAINIGKASVSLQPGSVLSDKIVIHSVEVRDAEITFEGNPLGANNLSKILANVNSMTPAVDQATTNAPASAAETTAEKKPAKKLQVDDLLITGAKVHAKLTGLVNLTGLANREINLTLPDIHLTGLGTGPDGITGADLSKKVLVEINADTRKALTAAVADLAKNVADAAKNAAKDTINGVMTNGTKAVGENVDKLKKSLGGFLGK